MAGIRTDDSRFVCHICASVVVTILMASKGVEHPII
jgi:hypothetical protein